MNTKVWLAAATALTVAAAGVGGTYALFSATTANSHNQFTAGTLCLDSERDESDSVPGPMFYISNTGDGMAPGPDGILGTADDEPGIHQTGLWAPGDDNTRTLTVYNGKSCTSMAAWLTKVNATLESGYSPMADHLQVEVLARLNGSDVVVSGDRSGGSWTAHSLPLSTFLSGPVEIRYPGDAPIPLLRGANMQMKFHVILDKSIDNSYQDKELKVTFTVYGVQQKNNPNPSFP